MLLFTRVAGFTLSFFSFHNQLSAPLMKTATLLILALMSGLAACTAAHDELTRSGATRGLVFHSTIVNCPVYDGTKTNAKVLAHTIAGNEVQVLDTVSAEFVRVRVDTDGKTLTGYMDRRCFGEEVSR
jgi:hypothetical protein